MNENQRKEVVELLLTSGETEQQAGRSSQALSCYKRALNLDSNNSRAYNKIGIVYDQLNNNKSALESFGRAYLINAGEQGVVDNLICALVKSKQYELAVKLLEKHGAIVKYPTAVSVMRGYLASQEGSQEREVKALLSIYDSFVRELGVPISAGERDLWLFVNFGLHRWRWRGIALSNANDMDFQKWVIHTGLEQVLSRQAIGKASILLLSHTGAGAAIVLALNRMGLKLNAIVYDDFYTGSGIRGIEDVTFLKVGGGDGKYSLKEVRLAYEVLQRGELLVVMGDGFQGEGAVQKEFLGKLRDFNMGFANLAQLTDTPIFPVFSKIAPDGVISVEVLQPLEVDPQSTRKKQREALLQQYIFLLEDYWKTKPGNADWMHVKKYLKM